MCPNTTNVSRFRIYIHILYAFFELGTFTSNCISCQLKCGLYMLDGKKRSTLVSEAKKHICIIFIYTKVMSWTSSFKRRRLLALHSVQRIKPRFWNQQRAEPRTLSSQYFSWKLQASYRVHSLVSLVLCFIVSYLRIRMIHVDLVFYFILLFRCLPQLQ